MSNLAEMLSGLGIPLFGKYGFPLIVGAFILLAVVYVSVEFRNTRKAKKSEKLLNEETADLTKVDEVEENDVDIEEHELNFGKTVTYSWKQLPNEEMIRRSQDFYGLMDKRRTVRCFSSETVPRQVIDNIIHTAGTSPSGAHQQPWTFLAISSPEIKAQLRTIIEDEEEINYKRRMGHQWVNALKKLNTNWIKPYLTEAPYILLVFKQVYSLKGDGTKQMHYYSEHSVSIAVGILLAAIHNAGLYSLTSTPLNCGTAISKLLGRPASEKLIYLMPIGFPSSECTVPDIKRKPLNAILKHI